MESDGPRRPFTQVPEDTMTYLKDVSAHLPTLRGDQESQELLAANVLEELQGNEVLVCTDKVASRLLEPVLAVASAKELVAFLKVVAASDTLIPTSSSPFGSHVLERVLDKLADLSQDAQPEEWQGLKEVLSVMVEVVSGSLYEFSTDRFATHVARKLLHLLSGQKPLSLGKRKAAAPADPEEGDEQVPLPEKSHHANGSSLADKLQPHAAASGAAALPPRFPALLYQLAGSLLQPEYKAAMSDLIGSSCASPFLQAVLKALAPNTVLLKRVILAVLSMGDIADSELPARLAGNPELAEMLADSGSSHLMEAVFMAAPGDTFGALYEGLVKGKLLQLAAHPSANFVVQAVLAAPAASKTQVKQMFAELESGLGDLLRRRRSGVVAALIAACGRTHACEKEACAALAKALAALPQWSTKKGNDALAPALLCLDTTAKLGQNLQQQDAAKLSAPGCAMLAAVFRLGPGACKPFGESLTALGRWDAGRVGKDAGGSRVMEAFLESQLPGKLKGKLLHTLRGHYFDIASSAPGSFLVEKCFDLGELRTKETIVSELAEHHTALEGLRWGPRLAQRLGVSRYLRSPEEWHKHVGRTARALQEFAAVFGGGSGGGGSGADENAGGKERGVQQPLDGGAGGAEAERKAQRKERKKEKRAKRAAALKDAAEQQPEETEVAAADEPPPTSSYDGAEAGPLEPDTTQTDAGVPHGEGKKRKRKEGSRKAAVIVAGAAPEGPAKGSKKRRKSSEATDSSNQ